MDKEFPELGLRKVVHCGWGGIDQFAIEAADFQFVLLINPLAVSEDDKITDIDWSRWGPIFIYQNDGAEWAKKKRRRTLS